MDKAYKLLLDQEQKKRALDVIQAGKEYVEHTVSISSAAVFTGSNSKLWAPCRRVYATSSTDQVASDHFNSQE